MTKIKMCGLTRSEDILAVNELRPDYIGFVFAPSSKRCISAEKAAELKAELRTDIKAVGVFVDEDIETVAGLLESGIIDIAQLHGHEDDDYIIRLREMTGCPVIRAFRIRSASDADMAEKSPADMILLDAGAGCGEVFDWSLIESVKRPFFLAGGLNVDNAGEAVRMIKPFGLDVSSGIETDGIKDKNKMAVFMAAIRKEETR